MTIAVSLRLRSPLLPRARSELLPQNPKLSDGDMASRPSRFLLGNGPKPGHQANHLPCPLGALQNPSLAPSSCRLLPISRRQKKKPPCRNRRSCLARVRRALISSTLLV